MVEVEREVLAVLVAVLAPLLAPQHGHNKILDASMLLLLEVVVEEVQV